MIRGYLLALSALMLLQACATKGLLEDADPFSIVQVTVTRAGEKVGTVNLPEDVRYKTEREASRYGRGGRQMRLEITLTDFRVKNPVLTWAIGDQNRLNASSRLVDLSSGATEQEFNSVVVDTSTAAVSGIIGSIAAAVDDPIEIEQRLATQFAERIMIQIYGSQAAKGAATEPAPPRYPRSYEELKREVECRVKRERAQIDQRDGDRGPTRRVKIPDYCR
ncbi:MAG: hypothetical protein AAF441_04830 [Pseudomonadota bacterium]